MSGIITQNALGNSGLVKAVEVAGGTWVEIKSLTASSSATLSFVDGADDVVLDSTYNHYVLNHSNNFLMSFLKNHLPNYLQLDT